ncbi:MAG: Nudix family hydrolase [Candidatus Thioglobus sp.]|nr:Nudix family hydrolase [Candidatus Thioglobus sp.]
METIKAVVGVLRNQAGELLISKRQTHQFMPGFWELPGGKIEPNETNEAAIIRELNEELGVQPSQLIWLKTLSYQYPERKVILNIYNINSHSGVPDGKNFQGKEGQEIAWVKLENLPDYNLLPTLQIFINSLILPDKYWITPAQNHQSSEWINAFDLHLNSGIKLIQLRSKVCLNRHFIKELSNKCQQLGTKLLLNIPNKNFTENIANGWHLTTAEMLELRQRPCGKNQLLGASAHNLSEAISAQTSGVDFVTISPVQPTKTHPNAAPIGWKTAAAITQKLNIPVYFLGGMTSADTQKSHQLGAQGIAAVSSIL